MHKIIDKLLANGKEDEAIPLIEQAWANKEQKDNAMLANIVRKIETLEKCQQSRRSNS
jgi:hypothetical protein